MDLQNEALSLKTSRRRAAITLVVGLSLFSAVAFAGEKSAPLPVAALTPTGPTALATPPPMARMRPGGSNGNDPQAGGSGYVYITMFYTDPSGGFAIRMDGTAACGGNGWWGLSGSDGTTPAAKNLYATAQAAFLAGKQVYAYCYAYEYGWDRLDALYVIK